MSVQNAVQPEKTVSDPTASYESIKPLWDRSRAVCSGERFVKDYDNTLDTLHFSNLLIPFSPTMTSSQYEFYKAEAELPGISAQFGKMLVGGLLRKKPILKLPESVPKDGLNWIMNNFGQDDASLAAFLDTALWEEIQTSRAWIYVDYPRVLNAEQLTPEETEGLKPYPILWPAENVINWRTKLNSKGQRVLSQIVVRIYEESFARNEFHPDLVDTVYVHELDNNEQYQIRKYQKEVLEVAIPVINGKKQSNTKTNKEVFVLKETNTNILMNGERLSIIPAWPLNGSIEVIEPMLTPIIDREIALYNKISRRNHLLYGASTYTPVITSDMSDEDFDDIVSAGLGSWLRLKQGDTATVLETPTGALADMDRAIASTVEDMAKLGIRMLSPETAQSGVALDLRNAAQTAQLGTFNVKTSSTMADVIAFMLKWRYDLDIKPADITFSLSADFNPSPLGENWLRLITEWYEGGLIPRSIWIDILKHNDIVPPEYNDEVGRQEITENASETIASKNLDFKKNLDLESNN